MWCFLKNVGFLSAVEYEEPNPDTEQGTRLMVRARESSHLAQAFPKAEIIETLDADYHWRVVVRRDEFAEVLLNAVEDIDYPSHCKEEISGSDKALYAAMLECWTAMYRYQQEGESWS
jgi:hypothetical protein